LYCTSKRREEEGRGKEKKGRDTEREGREEREGEEEGGVRDMPPPQFQLLDLPVPNSLM